VDALNLLREPSVPGNSVVEARRSGFLGGHASVPQGLIGDRKASDLAPVQLLWTAGAEVGDPGSSVVEARRSGCPGGHASVPQGLIGDRKASDLAPARLRGTTGAADGVRRSGCPGGHASAPQGLISDRKASDLAPSLSIATGSADCGLHVMVRQARDSQFEYLNAQQGALDDENGEEFWSNPQRGHDPNEMLDLVPMRCDAETRTI
jgi:hypothetical protein